MNDEHTQRHAVVSVARSWLGTPYHPNARLKGIGCDCGTLLAEVFPEAGVIPWIELDDYPPDWHLNRSEEKYLGYVRRFASEVIEPDVGDVLVWKFGRCFSHGGIYIGDGLMIHSHLGVGCEISRIDSEELLGRDRLVFSFWGVQS